MAGRGRKSFGADKVHPFLLSVVALSIKHGIFPNNLKIAKVIPIFKQGSRFICDNYRPISILPALSKMYTLSIKSLFFSLKILLFLIDMNSNETRLYYCGLSS